MNEAMENNRVQTCSQCDNHCPADALQCGRGRRYFGVADGGHEHGHGHGHHEHRDGKHHQHEGHGR